MMPGTTRDEFDDPYNDPNKEGYYSGKYYLGGNGTYKIVGDKAFFGGKFDNTFTGYTLESSFVFSADGKTFTATNIKTGKVSVWNRK
jgi:hypothetical protein